MYIEELYNLYVYWMLLERSDQENETGGGMYEMERAYTETCKRVMICRRQMIRL